MAAMATSTSPVDGKPMRRIDADELEVLLDTEDAPTAS
jgi:hypothetical protein